MNTALRNAQGYNAEATEAETPRRRIQVADVLLPALAPWLQRLPLTIRETAEAIIETPERFFDAEDVATRARLSRRHVDRLLAAHGMAAAKQLVIACRAFAVVRLLADERSSITAAAELVGYDGQRGIRRHSESIWGVPPRIAAQWSQEDLVRGVIAFVTREAPAPEPPR